MTSAFLNALREEGTRDEMFEQVVRLFDERNTLQDVTEIQALTNTVLLDRIALLEAEVATATKTKDKIIMGQQYLLKDMALLLESMLPSDPGPECDCYECRVTRRLLKRYNEGWDDA